MLSDEDAEQAVAIKMTRQEILDRPDGPRLWAVFHESVLCCEVGGPALMRNQCKHLLKMRQHPRVVIQVVPNTARYIRERAEVARYALTFDYLRATALADDKTAGLIGAIGND